MSICSVSDCDRGAHRRGWCHLHYQRWYRNGDPLYVAQKYAYVDTAARFWDKVAKGEGPDACWLWTAYASRKGYGQFGVASRKVVPAHRYAYELSKGPIPADMQIDHRCRNRLCVNPDHLRLATPKQNSENRAKAGRRDAIGVRGVKWNSARRKWEASVCDNYRNYYLGLFDDLGTAEAVVTAKRNELHSFNDDDRAAHIA